MDLDRVEFLLTVCQAGPCLAGEMKGESSLTQSMLAGLMDKLISVVSVSTIIFLFIIERKEDGGGVCCGGSMLSGSILSSLTWILAPFDVP